MSDIKINYDGLLQNKNDLTNRIEDLVALNSRVTTLLSQIESGWTGKTSDRYIVKMNEQMKKAERMISVLNEFKTYIERVIQEFKEEDANGARRINGC